MRLAIALSCLCLMAFSPPPVNLGQSGLDVLYRLYDTEDGETWEEYDGEEELPEFSDIGSGDYSIAGLPDANGDTQYQLIAYINGAEESSVATIYWSAVQTRIAAQLVYARPTSGPFKVGDTFGTIQLVVNSGLTSDIEDATATVSMKRQGASSATFTGRSAVISDIEDVSDGSKSATFTYTVQSGDFTRSGRYRVEFYVEYDGGAVETLPKSVGGVQVEVIDRIN